MRKLDKVNKTDVMFVTKDSDAYDALYRDNVLEEFSDISWGFYGLDHSGSEPRLAGLKFAIFSMRAKKDLDANKEVLKLAMKRRGFVYIDDKDRDIPKVLELVG